MLDGFPALAHFLRMCIKPRLDLFKNVLMFPPRDAALLARGAFIPDGAGLADIRPVTAQGQAVLDSAVAEGQTLAGRTDVNIVLIAVGCLITFGILTSVG